MNNDQLKKLVAYTKEMPEAYKMIKNLILDYLSIKEQNKKLVETNLKLMEEVLTYEERIAEELEIVIH
jgi:hypothetical protein